MRQQSFKEFHVARGHSNLGMGFQAEIDAANKSYRAHGLAHVDRNPNEWKYTTPNAYAGVARNSPSTCARTMSGRFIIMVKSNVDYTGGGASFSVAFDAKETGRASIPLDNFKPEQIERLVEKERCGVRAGFLICFTRDDAVYWIGATKVREAYDLAKYQAAGRATHPKSLSREWLGEHGYLLEIPRTSTVRVDYLRAVAPELFPVRDSAATPSGAGVI